MTKAVATASETTGIAGRDCKPGKLGAASRAGSRTDSRAELMSRWQAAYGCPPPGVRSDLLLLSDGWHRQAKRLGGLSKDAKRRLTREVARIVAENQAKLAAAGAEARDGIIDGSMSRLRRTRPWTSVTPGSPASRRRLSGERSRDGGCFHPALACFETGTAAPMPWM